METSNGVTVGEIARLAGVSVRTLHHYDQVGLVRPGGRTEAGYRLYGHAEIERLQEVLFFRELGFGLGEIEEVLARPDYRRTDALARQREMLEARVDRLLGMIEAIESTMATESRGVTMSKENMLEVFDGFDHEGYQAEAQDRWGDTDAYQESARRTGGYGPEQWATIKAEGAALDAEFLALMADNVAPDSSAAMAVAERHRAHVTEWFYDCTYEIHAGLGEMYVADPRFTGNIDRAGAGLAAYMSAAIGANSDRQTG